MWGGVNFIRIYPVSSVLLKIRKLPLRFIQNYITFDFLFKRNLLFLLIINKLTTIFHQISRRNLVANLEFEQSYFFYCSGFWLVTGIHASDWLLTIVHSRWGRWWRWDVRRWCDSRTRRYRSEHDGGSWRWATASSLEWNYKKKKQI